MLKELSETKEPCETKIYFAVFTDWTVFCCLNNCMSILDLVSYLCNATLRRCEISCNDVFVAPDPQLLQVFAENLANIELAVLPSSPGMTGYAN